MVRNSFIGICIAFVAAGCNSTHSEVALPTPIPNPSGTAPVTFSSGSGVISMDSDSISNTVQDTNITLDYAYSENGFRFYDQVYIADFYHDAYSLESDDLTWNAWTFKHRRNAIFGSDYNLEGTLASNTPLGLVSFNGSYFAAYPVGNNGIGHEFTLIHVEVNFEAGTFVGFDHRQIDIVDITGTVDGNLIEGTIYGPQGTFEFEGGFFGENGETLAAGFQSGDVVGLIHANLDQERTDLIN